MVVFVSFEVSTYILRREGVDAGVTISDHGGVNGQLHTCGTSQCQADVSSCFSWIDDGKPGGTLAGP